MRARAKETGIVSERTAEFVLAPTLAALLSTQFPRSLPISFWFTREGRQTTVALGVEYVRLIAAFARRPKAIATEAADIVVKVNEPLFEYASRAAPHGMPTLAGVPLASSILGLAAPCECAWFLLDGSRVPTDPLFMRLSVKGGHLVDELPAGIAGPLQASELLEIVATRARPMRWAIAAEMLLTLKRAHHRSWSPWFGGYRPFHVLVPALD